MPQETALRLWASSVISARDALKKQGINPASDRERALTVLFPIWDKCMEEIIKDALGQFLAPGEEHVIDEAMENWKNLDFTDKNEKAERICPDWSFAKFLEDIRAYMDIQRVGL